MSDFTTNDQIRAVSEPVRPMRKKVSRQTVIHVGLEAMQDIGADPVCQVCIASGGSCCDGCRHLADGVGCRLRNTSCTAWLCGFLKLVLYETGHLQGWNDFWAQVPGQSFRVDFTPDYVFIKQPLYIPNRRELGQALAADLRELSQAQVDIIALRESIDKAIDQLLYYKNDSRKRTKLQKTISRLTSPFHRFHSALSCEE